jgi:hypothetical protein
MAISVNMLRLPVRIDAQPRSKNGHPAHSTTGVASASWIQLEVCDPSHMCRSVRWLPISSRNTGRVSASPIQSRRVISTSSGLGPASAVASSGSSAMPQMGQAPGPTCRISGCMGHVYMVPSGTGFARTCSGARYFSGSARNRSRHLAEQK